MNDTHWETVLGDGLADLGLDHEPGAGPLFAYVRELERWNGALGLVHASGAELVIRHILDSLAAVAVVRELTAGLPAPSIGDIGSGGGLPGVPLACFMPEATVHLVERSGRKCGFLRGVAPVARIRNLTVIPKDLTEVDRAFTLVVFRAFRPLTDDLVRDLQRVIVPGGVMCAYKGRRERVDAEVGSLSARTIARLRIDVIPVTVPFLDEERHLVLVRDRRL